MVTASTEIEALQQEILEKKKRLAELKRAEPRQKVEDYVFESSSGPVRLSELFGDKTDLLVVHNMGKSCVYCTLWADGFNGVSEHLENRAGFVLVSPDPVEVQQEFAKSRGWRFRMVSDQERRFTREMGYFPEDSPWPGVTGFRRLPDGTIERVATAPLGEGDDFCSVWPMLDLLAEGYGGWEPKYSY